jgi:hypothetical protein
VQWLIFVLKAYGVTYGCLFTDWLRACQALWSRIIIPPKASISTSITPSLQKS